MSYCRQEGKDTIIFLTKEDEEKPSTALFSDDIEDEPGLILPNGDINWNCPCLGGMATGPCGVEFREAFSCFHYSKAELKGSDCYEQFKTMQDCMLKYPDVYGMNDKEEDEDHQEISVDNKDEENQGNSSEDNSPSTTVTNTQTAS